MKQIKPLKKQLAQDFYGFFIDFTYPDEDSEHGGAKWGDIVMLMRVFESEFKLWDSQVGMFSPSDWMQGLPLVMCLTPAGAGADRINDFAHLLGETYPFMARSINPQIARMYPDDLAKSVIDIPEDMPPRYAISKMMGRRMFK